MSVIPYLRFQECQDRRQQIVAELLRPPDPPLPIIDVEVKPVPAGSAPVQPLKANS